ncbi:uncharacterized protein K452DRAFT_88599 [Aplosporella prunicola CBS 121167]|uniref:Uncharacterized protein n=1 Tax=Aplosporella prunicola CBS 121167 TaxID=1176127 RepID=A0A6A6B5L9_9PEZI|nr:uncharacterized protein K452DRAFT_88599 [Aplosporella prunicola CBS 121167]KAF2138575.1 hypothetical protein K452DRAFT_88599 [Aplosporella prunicola CBS 121167]
MITTRHLFQTNKLQAAYTSNLHASPYQKRHKRSRRPPRTKFIPSRPVPSHNNNNNNNKDKKSFVLRPSITYTVDNSNRA